MLSEMDKYLEINAKTNNYDIVIAGDFNFTPKEVVWIKKNEGIFPDIKNRREGAKAELKAAFQLLYDIMIKHNLTQLVDKPTRKNNTFSQMSQKNSPNA